MLVVNWNSYELCQFLRVLASKDFDLIPSFLIDETSDDGPHSGEEHWRIYDEHVSHDLGVVIGPHFRGKLDQAVDLRGKQRALTRLFIIFMEKPFKSMIVSPCSMRLPATAEQAGKRSII